MNKKKIISLALSSIILAQVVATTNVQATDLANDKRIIVHEKASRAGYETVEETSEYFQQLSPKEFVELIAERQNLSFEEALMYTNKKLGRNLEVSNFKAPSADLVRSLMTSNFTGNNFQYIEDEFKAVSLGQIVKEVTIESGDFRRSLKIEIPAEITCFFDTVVKDNTTKLSPDFTGHYEYTWIDNESATVQPMGRSTSIMTDPSVTVRSYNSTSAQVTVGVTLETKVTKSEVKSLSKSDSSSIFTYSHSRTESNSTSSTSDVYYYVTPTIHFTERINGDFSNTPFHRALETLKRWLQMTGEL